MVKINSTLRQKAIGEIAAFMAQRHGLAEHDREFGERVLERVLGDANRGLKEFDPVTGGKLALSAFQRAGVSEATAALLIAELSG